MLAVALDRYVEVEVEPADRLSVHCEGEGSEIAEGARHLAAKVATEVAGHDRLRITVRSEIPVGRGLGSSAALAAAAAAAAGGTDPLLVAARADGHPDNAAASVLGGLVAAANVDGTLRTAHLALDPAIAFVALVPDRSLPTRDARRVLPGQLHREDAVFNMSRLALLLAGLADHRQLEPEATGDRLHQEQRATLFPQAPRLLAALVEGGALASCWSGAGPTVLGITTLEDEPKVAAAGRDALAATGLAGDVLSLRPDREGLLTGAGARLPG